MRPRWVFFPVILVVLVSGCGLRTREASFEPWPNDTQPSVEVAVQKEAGALGTFRAAFTFPGGWRAERDVLVVLAPFSAKRDREGKYDPARLFHAAEALIGGLGEGDRVNVLSYQDLLRGESWFPNEFPFVENADDLFIRPVMAFDEWKRPAEAVIGLKALRERGIETLRNTSYFIEMLRAAALAFEPGDKRVREIIVLADSHSVPTKGFFSGLPVEVPEVKLEPLDPEWTAALFHRLRTGRIHVNFVVVAQDEDPAFSGKRLRRMAESTRGFYFDWPDDEAARRRCVEHIATGLYRGLEVDFGASDANYIYTNRWSPSADEAFVIYGRYNRPGNYTFTLRDTTTGHDHPFEVTLPQEGDSFPELEAEWGRRRFLDGLWRLATYGPDDYLTYDLQQLAHRYGLELPEALRPSPFDGKAEAVKFKRPLGKGRPMEVPVLDEDAALPPHSALAELAPYDMVYVRYNRIRSALELLDMGYFYGRDVIQALGLHPDLTMLEEKVQTQMCVRISRKLTKLYEAAVAEVAQVSTGASIGEGLDVCFIMRLKMPIAYRLRINQFRKQAIEDYPGTRKRRFRHEGVVVTETLGHHNVIRSYFAMFKHTPRGATKPRWFAVSGNSWASVRRVLDVHVGKVPSVLANEDFARFREKLPLGGFTNEATGEQFGENVFVYFGARAALALTDWRVEALKKEQQAVASHLHLSRNALASYARDRGVLLDEPRWPDAIMGTLVENGYLPAIPGHPGIGAYAFDPDLQVFYSTRYGRLGWLTPMADLIDQLGEPRYGKPELGATAAQLAWTDDVILSHAITRPDPKDFKFAILRALAGKETSDFSTFRELMQRPGLAVAMKSRLLQFGGRGLGMSKEAIALKILANKIKGEIKKAISWEGDDDPFAWAGDEVCVVLDPVLAHWRTALIDPPLAFGIEVKDKHGAAAFLGKIARARGTAHDAVDPISGIVTANGWSVVMLGEEHPVLVVARDARFFLGDVGGFPGPPIKHDDSDLRRFLPKEGHALVRFDTTRGDQLVKTALGLYGPAAEEQAQRVMARFESLYGNRLAPFRLEEVPMLDEAPRPAGSQYGIDPVERRIASNVYGLPGDFLLSGRVPADAGIRKVLAQKAVGYGTVVLHKDSIEFVGAAPNPGIAAWKKERPPSSMAVSRRIRELRTTDSLRKLAAAVREHDGYLWRLGLGGFDVEGKRFLSLLRSSRQMAVDIRPLPMDVEVARDLTAVEDWPTDWQYDLYVSPVIVHVCGELPAVVAQDFAAKSLCWQRTALLLGPPAGCHGLLALAYLEEAIGMSELLQGVGSSLDVAAVMVKHIGRDVICGGRDAVEVIREQLGEMEVFDTTGLLAKAVESMRELLQECLPFIEQQQ